MPSVARSNRVVAHRGSPAPPVAVAHIADVAPSPPLPAPVAPVAPVPLPAAVEADRQRTVTAVLDQLRFGVVTLVRGVAERLTTRPSSVRFGALELEVRDTVLAIGRDLLTELVRLRGTGYRGHSYVCPCGVRLVLKELAPLQQRTSFGTITLERAVYAGAACRVRAHHVPLDVEWGLLSATGAEPEPPAAASTAWPDPDGGALVAVAPGTGPARLAPAFAAIVVEFGARLPFVEAARLLELALGTPARLAPNTVDAYTTAAGRARQHQEDSHRVRTDPPALAERRAVGDQPLPARPATAPDTLVITMDGALERTHQGWKEVKLGAVYNLVRRMQRVGGEVVTRLEAGATTYTATLAVAQTFARQLVAVAQRRGLGWARQVVVLGDGAKWIWKLADRRFPRAVQIVDWFHAREHLWELAQLLYGEGTAAAHTWLETLASALWVAQTTEDVGILAAAADEAWATPRKDLPDGTPRRTQARHQEMTKAIAYFTRNASRIRYGAFREQELPVGSGVVEGGCHSVLHVRLKRPGACWSPASAEAMVRARAVLCSDPTPVCPHPSDRLAS
jgi:hypothetical protein